MNNGYFFCGDILGFSNITKNLNHETELTLKIDAWVSLVDKAASQHSIKFKLVSDTVFAVIDNDTELPNLINFARQLLEDGIEQSLPIRGAITYGKYTWKDDIVYGQAVIDSHNIEKSQSWIGVTINNRNFNQLDYEKNNIICYQIPMSDRVIELLPAIIWNVPNQEDLMKKLCVGGLTKSGEQLKYKWAEKITNTTIFRLYVKLARKKKFKFHQFYGKNPLELIELLLNKN